MDFDLSGGGINSSKQLGLLDPVSWDAELQKANKLAVTQAGLTVKVNPTLKASSGLLSGSVALTDMVDEKKVPRTLGFSGLYIPDLDNPAASTIRGFFTLPELPAPGGNSSTILSGTLEITPSAAP